MGESWDARLKFQRYLAVLRFTRPAVFHHFQHGAVIRGTISSALGVHYFPHGLIPFACESGRVRFEVGEKYRIGITVVGMAEKGRSLPDRLSEGLRRIGREKPSHRGPLPVLGGNFNLLSFEPIPPPDLAREQEALAGRTQITLRFLSPFRLERPQEFIVKGAKYLNQECFPPQQFLSRLWNHLFNLENGRYATIEEITSSCLPVPADVRTDPLNLQWIDIPDDGKPARKPEQPKGITLGGIVGRVVFTGLSDNWKEAISLGRHLHVGKSTAFGQGRYIIEEVAEGVSDPFRPSASLLERVADPNMLDKALSHVLSRPEAPGVDNVSWSDFALSRNFLLENLSRDLLEGRYKPSPLLWSVEPNDNGRLHAFATPTVRDRVAQQAACEVLGPAVEILLEDCSYAYRKGFSRKGAAQAVWEAHEEGYRFVLDADITSLFYSVDWERLFGKLDALFPFEPLIGIVKEWIRAPVIFEGKHIERTRGLPLGPDISPLIAKLFLSEFEDELLGRDFRIVRQDDFVVLCKDMEATRKAKKESEEVLTRLGQNLIIGKKDARSLDNEFPFLINSICCSSAFVNGIDTEIISQPPCDSLVPSSLWLAQVPLQTVKILSPRKSAATRRLKKKEDSV
ncbi:MAG: CRISPR system precrRNA processing endoribonuclease RAMP protein Cas6 [Deltaproteobacteria bacterium]|nr:CRISPR system precrRNA processing endoribonuclease RAMP protein Cas6 [Deltaproteobacteria bacterium]